MTTNAVFDLSMDMLLMTFPLPLSGIITRSAKIYSGISAKTSH
jgi:hypothetical protein